MVPGTLRESAAASGQGYGYGSVVLYQCMDGYQFDLQTPKRPVTCRDDGNWYPEPTSLYCTGNYKAYHSLIMPLCNKVSISTDLLPHDLVHLTFIVR